MVLRSGDLRRSRGAVVACGLLGVAVALAAPAFALGRRAPAAGSGAAERPRRVPRQDSASPAPDALRLETLEEASLLAAKASLASASAAERGVAAQAFEAWRRQFPMVAKLRSFYCGRNAEGAEIHVPCGRSHVEARFLGVARELGVDARQALDILGSSLDALNEPDAKLARKARALFAKAGREEALELLRAAPKFLGSMSACEWEARELPDIRARAALDNAFDALSFPVRFVFDRTRDVTAALMESNTENADDAPSKEQLQAMADKRKNTYNVLSAVFWPLFVGGVLWLCYMDSSYGGPIHGRGVCVPSIVPSYNIPDANGNARLPCTCAPLYKWYVEPLLTEDQKVAFEPPKVESQNCGKTIGGEKQACDPKTVGGCVWSAEDLSKDPSYWDPPERRLTHWEQQRCSDESRFCGIKPERIVT